MYSSLHRRARSRRRLPHLAGAVAATLALAACSPAADVETRSADQRAVPIQEEDRAADPAGGSIDDQGAAADPDLADDPGVDDDSPPPTGADDPSDDEAEDGSTAANDPLPPAEIDPLAIDPDAIDFGEQKPAQPWDEFALAAATDVERWFTDIFPNLYGQEFEPLAGGVLAGYPTRQDALPGCGEPTTTYRDVNQFAAFYCALDDFIIYDDSPDGLLGQLATTFGPATIGIVIAHEYAHAAQQRIGALELALPTVITEQQADCFSGAWAGRRFRGEPTAVPFTDEDVRAGLIAMIEVEDPIGIDLFQPGGHGSGFDRVGAFQVGFQDGPRACVPLLDDPLPLSPNRFVDQEDALLGGNAPFGFAEGELFSFLPDDLNAYWGVEVADAVPGFEALTVVPIETAAEATCGTELVGTDGTATLLCAESNTVFLIVPDARVLYDDFGDFALGYALGKAWAEAAQIAVGSPLQGEPRALLNDCLTGAWVSTVTPDRTGALPLPRAEGRTALISPGDLTEAIQLAILVGDATVDANVVGFPFAKIDQFRRGALNGLATCDL